MIINSWILWNHTDKYRNRDAKIVATNNWRRDRLFRFKAEIARVLLHRPNLHSTPLSVHIVKNIRSPSSYNSDDNNDQYKSPKKKLHQSSSLVSPVLRYDKTNHLPQFVSTSDATRCKNETCTKKSRWICTKCQVHVCITPQKNYFSDYHVQH
ncbi:unnamed protein product [Didymodactylos carnosus]|uniref:PiggyBac transposable element-derived protein domain-containing protein n=1 Tax=Didymodactylos carnosus TaxID=1234261 RepID=A0A815G8A0_9BILA|nr:unnamed protein product [Didymodactylos carnosus]CAF1335428.1 unnamed protein product [Didymodactylos carnosus]CAF3752415.1 unnamed protein product [Didymodactylos carnosus]CAF4192189.1 unnamed protein product [Didymodactylos carnosus]